MVAHRIIIIDLRVKRVWVIIIIREAFKQRTGPEYLILDRACSSNLVQAISLRLLSLFHTSQQSPVTPQPKYQKTMAEVPQSQDLEQNTLEAAVVADADSSPTYPAQCSSLRKNGYVILKSRPCKISHISACRQTRPRQDKPHRHRHLHREKVRRFLSVFA